MANHPACSICSVHVGLEKIRVINRAVSAKRGRGGGGVIHKGKAGGDVQRQKEAKV